MKKLNRGSLAAGLVAISLCSTPALAQSQDAVYIAQNIQSAANRVIIAINAFAAYVSSRMDADMKGVQPNIEAYQQVNPYTLQLTTDQRKLVTKDSVSAIEGILGPSLNASMKYAMASMIAGDSLPPPKVSNPAMLQNCGNNMFNFELFIGPSSYANQTLDCDRSKPQNISSYANSYIQNASNQGSPISQLSLNQLVANNSLTLAQATELQKSPEWVNFEMSRRNALSNQSAGLSNLYYLYHQRVPNADGVSPELLADQIANSRTGNKKWYEDMNTAFSTVLLRENVFIMAEIQRELHEMRKENQRLLAIQSLAILGGVEFAKQYLTLGENAVNEKIKAMTTASQ